MRTIKLTHGHVAMVDDEDYEHLNQFRWFAKVTKAKSRDHVCAAKKRFESQGLLLMHRYILGLTDPADQVDHIDRNPLNNQRSNLRVCKHRDNMCNRTPFGTSKFLGVHLIEESGRWIASIAKQGMKKMYLGTFASEEDAARAYDRVAKVIHGEFSNLNFPEHEAKQDVQ